jgi:hypothetical protein
MYAVVRTYSRQRASELFDLFGQPQEDVKALISGVPGFVNYVAVRSGDGGVTVTVCEDGAGTEESPARGAVGQGERQRDNRPARDHRGGHGAPAQLLEIPSCALPPVTRRRSAPGRHRRLIADSTRLPRFVGLRAGSALLLFGRSGSRAERHRCVEAYPPWRTARRPSLRVGCVAAIGFLDLALLGKLGQPGRHAAAIEIEALRYLAGRTPRMLG